MFALIIAIVDIHSFGEFIHGNLSTVHFIINLLSTSLISISTIATVFSGIDYIKDWKQLFKD